MSVEYRKDRRLKWRAVWRNPFTGQKESASFATKQEAEKHDSLIKHRLKYDRDSFRDGAAPSRDELILDDLLNIYIKRQKREAESLASELSHARCILSAKVKVEESGALHPFGHIIVTKLTRKHVAQVVASQQLSNVKPSTIHRRLAIVSAALRWAEEEGLITENPVPRFRRPKATPERFPPPTLEEQDRLIAAAAPHIRRIITIGVALGLRVGSSELLRLKWADFDSSLESVRVTAARKNPDRPWRDLFVREDLRPILAAWRAEDEAARREAEGRGEATAGLYEHVVNFRGRQVNSIKNGWRNTLRRAGIERRIRPYDLRHAFATYALDNGANLKAVAENMGHADVQMVLRHYGHVINGQRRDAMLKAPLPSLPQADSGGHSGGQISG